jgi:hypothetical protein
MIATPYHPLKLPQPIRPVPSAIAANLENADTPLVRGPSSLPLVKATVQDTIAGMAEVTLSGPNATDVQLNRIRALPTLKKLYLIDTQITGDGLEQLKELAQLEHLVIQGHQASDSGLERIKTLSHLRKLELWGDGITKKGIKYLEGMTRLEELDLGHTQVTDAGLQHLIGMKQLRILTLDSTQLTDAGLEHLKSLNQLQKLYFYVGGNGITKEGMKSLQQALPKCKLFGLR